MKAADRDARVEAEIAAPLREASPALDDLHRARLASALEAALDAEDLDRGARRARGEDRPRQRRRGRIVMVAGAVAAVAALILVIAARPRGSRAPAPTTPGTVTTTLPAKAAPSLLRPYQGPNGDAPEAMAPSTSLVALRGEKARASIGTRVRLTLVGAGRVSVLAAARDGDIELALDGGRLLVDYEGHAGGTLRVRSPGAITTVVGTLFAVEVMGAGSRVAVARGKVRTEDLTGGGAQVVAGSSWTTTDGWPAPIPDDLAAALAEHETGWARRSADPEPDRGAVTPGPERARPSAAARRAGADLDALYARAEAAMRERSLGEARRALETVAARDPRGPLGEAALLDLARLALADGDRAEARRALARLPSTPRDPALAETAAHLRCRARQSTAAAGSTGADCDGALPRDVSSPE